MPQFNDPPGSSHETQRCAVTGPSLPRWRGQFSLRTMFWAVTAVCVIAGEIANGDLSWYFNVYCSLVMLHGLVLVWAYVAWTSRRPDRCVLVIVTAIAAGSAIVPLIRHEGYGDSLLTAVSMIQLTPALLCWPTAWLTWRVLRRTPHDFDGAEVRTAALRSLLGGGLLCCYAAVVLYSNWHRLEPGFFNKNDALFPAAWVAVGGSLAAAIPWIKLLRRRARGAATSRGWIDVVAKVLLATGIAIAMLAWVAVAHHFAVREATEAQYLGGIGWVIGYGLCFVLPQLASTGLFLLGLLIELYRDRWNPVLTAVGCAYFIPIWLIVAYDARLVFLPFWLL